MATRIIGIDFGTSTTVVRVHNVGPGNRIVPLSINGQTTIPTIAFKAEYPNEGVYFGYDALAKIDSKEPGASYQNFKMDLISEDMEVRARAEDFVQGFLKYIYREYQRQVNENTFDPASEVKVYVSHPAKWNSHARALMKQSVVAAGFCPLDNVSLKDEPTAAFLAVIHERNEELKQAGMLFEGRKYKAMMIDMGAGTTDIVLCSYMVKRGKLQLDDIFTYPTINAPGLCGGREIDQALIEKAEEFVYRMQGKHSEVGERVLTRLRSRIKRWKDLTISQVLRSKSVLPEPDEISGYRDTLKEFGVPILNESERFSISRKAFESLSREHWEQWVKLLQGAFNDVRSEQYASLDCPKRPEEVELMIITGGHSQWYIVPEYLSGKSTVDYLSPSRFTAIQAHPECLVQSANPQETVAVGLCYLDEDVVGAIAASNSVSMSFTCEGKYLGSEELIRKGTPLPFEKRDFLIKQTIKGNFIYRKEFTIEYSVVTDSVNTIKKSRTIPSDGLITSLIKAVLSMLGVAILDIPRILYYFLKGDIDKLDGTLIEAIIDNDYPIELSPDIYVNEEGIIKVGGTIKVDGETLNIPEITI